MSLLLFIRKGLIAWIQRPKPTITPSPSRSRHLGRDEMNLAEFPITLLTDRVPKDQKEAIYQDEIYDERTGLTLTRKLTITAGNHGLTTAVDDEVILALIQLTRQKNNFTNRKVEFSRHELIQLLDWSVGRSQLRPDRAFLRPLDQRVPAVRERLAGQPDENLDHRTVSISLIIMKSTIAGRPAISST